MTKISQKEYGGYFELELPDRKAEEFYKGDNLVKLNTARNAMLYVITAKNYKKVYIPYYMCPSVIKKMKDEKINIELYFLDKNFFPKIDPHKLANNEALIYPNYFGLFNKEARLVSNIYKNVIIDNTQAFYDKPKKNIDTIYAPRKFFAVADGSYLFTDKKLNQTLPTDVSAKRYLHMLIRLEESANKAYGDFVKKETDFEKAKLKNMSILTEKILKSFDYKKISYIRKKNYKLLHAHLKDLNLFPADLKKGCIPFCYPLVIKNEQIRQYLIQQKIYVSQLWKDCLENTPKTSLEYQYSKYLLPLPIDQRYGKKDMDYLAKTIKDFLNIQLVPIEANRP